MTELKLKEDWRFLTTNEDSNGLEFISTAEHSRYPIYGLQFHPQKNIYEWGLDKPQPHSAEAIRVAQFFANFFVNEGKKTGTGSSRWAHLEQAKWQSHPCNRPYRPVGL
jgi:gamma-glutamyl hydrolase